MSKYDISFIMPAKNEEQFITDAIESIVRIGKTNWELIVIDDHSSDNTFDIISDYRQKHPNITVERNRGNGKVAGLNFGYALSSANIIKCIDADDLIDAKLFDYLSSENGVSCHDYFIVKSNLKMIGVSRINPFYLEADYKTCLKNLISIPRCAWSFTREIADKIFPIPDVLPFEDFWFSLIIKRYSDEIKYIPEPLYYYRQNSGQTYGGMLNYSEELIRFRAKRVIRVIDYLENEPDNRLTKGLNHNNLFDEIKTYYEILLEKKPTMSRIAASGLKGSLLVKAILLKKANWLFPLLQRIQWMLRK